MKYILLILTFITSTAFAQFDTKSIETKVINGMFGFTNLIQNPSCKRNVVGITGSSVAAVRNTTAALDNISDCTWNPTATSQTLTYTFDSLPAGLKGQNCEARISYLGDASLVKANVQINAVNVAGDVQLTNSGTNAAVASINYPCGDGSTATTLVLTSTGDAANVQYAVYGGQATNLSSSIGPQTFSAKVSSAGVVSSENYDWINGNCTSTSPYTCTFVSGFFTAAPNCVATQRRPGGLNRTIGTESESTTSVIINTGTANTTSSALVDTEFTLTCTRASTDVIQNVINSNISGSYYSGYHDSTCSFARTNAAYGAFTADATCALVQRQARGIAAAATGSVLPSLALTLPATGTYYICAYPNSFAAGNGGLRMTDGTTVIVESNDQSTTRTEKALCGSYVASSLTPTITIEGKSSSGAITIDTTSTTSAIEWSIFPITNNMPAPVLVGSITSNATGALRQEYLQFGGGASGGLATSACTTTPCTVAAQSGSWISSVARGSTGQYTATVAAGIFSSVPYCVGNAGLFGVATAGFADVSATNATTIRVNAYSNAGTTLTDNVITLFCMGPR